MNSSCITSIDINLITDTYSKNPASSASPKDNSSASPSSCSYSADGPS